MLVDFNKFQNEKKSIKEKGVRTYFGIGRCSVGRNVSWLDCSCESLFLVECYKLFCNNTMRNIINIQRHCLWNTWIFCSNTKTFWDVAKQQQTKNKQQTNNEQTANKQQANSKPAANKMQFKAIENLSANTMEIQRQRQRQRRWSFYRDSNTIIQRPHSHYQPLQPAYHL